VVDCARKKKIFVENNLLSHFIHFQLQNNAPYALKLHLMKANLGQIIPVPLKYLIFAMQNSSCGTPHGSDFFIAPVFLLAFTEFSCRRLFLYTAQKNHKANKQ
jgi:hypothetical protein